MNEDGTTAVETVPQDEEEEEEFVWVRLYYKSEEEVEMQENLIDVGLAEKINGRIIGLAKRLKEKDMENDLRHCDRGRIHVYPPGTAPPYSNTNLIPPGKMLVNLIEELKHTTPPTSDVHPLIVVAPAPTRHPLEEMKLQQMQIQQLGLLKIVSEEVNKIRKSRLNCWERESLRTTGSKTRP